MPKDEITVEMAEYRIECDPSKTLWRVTDIINDRSWESDTFEDVVRRMQSLVADVENIPVEED